MIRGKVAPVVREQMMAQDEEGLLRRWSRRKLEQREQQRQAVSPAAEKNEGAAPAVPSGDTPPATTDAPPELPPIDSLTRDSDFTVFLREGVPEELRRQALRTLWRSDPVFANLDGMLEYGEDYNQLFKSGAASTLKTLYRVGQGYLADEPATATGSPGSEPDTADAAASSQSPEPAAAEAQQSNHDGAPAPDADTADPTLAQADTAAETNKT